MVYLSTTYPGFLKPRSKKPKPVVARANFIFFYIILLSIWEQINAPDCKWIQSVLGSYFVYFNAPFQCFWTYNQHLKQYQSKWINLISQQKVPKKIHNFFNVKIWSIFKQYHTNLNVFHIKLFQALFNIKIIHL